MEKERTGKSGRREEVTRNGTCAVKHRYILMCFFMSINCSALNEWMSSAQLCSRFHHEVAFKSKRKWEIWIDFIDYLFSKCMKWNEWVLMLWCVNFGYSSWNCHCICCSWASRVIGQSVSKCDSAPWRQSCRWPAVQRVTVERNSQSFNRRRKWDWRVCICTVF